MGGLRPHGARHGEVWGRRGLPAMASASDAPVVMLEAIAPHIVVWASPSWLELCGVSSGARSAHDVAAWFLCFVICSGIAALHLRL